MDHDVADAIPGLVSAGLLTPEEAAPLLREARGERLSVRAELRTALYLGVLLVTGGVGMLVAENLDRIGPVTIAAGIGLAALAALAWVVRHQRPFTWGEGAPTHLGFDYVLLLAALLAAADLAYVEAKFSPLGASWPWHLLIVAVAYAVAAVRWDSRLLFGLALTTFTAWRGISVGVLGSQLVGDVIFGRVRANAVACGVAFLLLGAAMVRFGRKAHFEPATLHLGWLLVLGGVGGGMFDTGNDALAWALALLVVAGGLAAWGWRRRRFALFAYGLVAGYCAVSRLVLNGPVAEALGCFWFAFSGFGMVAALWFAHRSLRGADEA